MAIAERPTTAPRPRRAQRQQATPRSASWTRFATPRVDLGIALALFLFALATRWPYLMRLPHFTDETVELRLAIEIWRGQALPLHGWGYYGPLHAYINAAALWLFGPHMILPRAIVMVFGALTVVATYLLGRELGGRGVATLGALLLATAPQHIIVNSHVAWFNSTTPFYTTLSCWALVRALRLFGREREEPAAARPWWRRGGPWLTLAGFLYGLALQTHPGTIVLAPALAAAFLYAVWSGRLWRLWRGPWPYAGVAAGLLAYSPVLIYNLTNNLYGVRRVQTKRSYAYESDPSWDSYRENLTNLTFELARIVSNPMRIPERPLHYLTSPYLVIAVGLCLTGLALLARRGRPLPLFAFLSTAAILPWFNHAYGVDGDRYLLTGRYVTFLLPPADLAIAAAAFALAGAALARLPRRWRGLPTREMAVAAPVVLMGCLVLYPLQPLARYYTHESEKDPANATFLETVRVVNANRGPRTPILVDRYFEKVDLDDGAEALDIIDYLLILDRVPHRLVEDPGAELRRVIPTLDPNDTEALPLIIMPRDRCWPLRNKLPLERVSHTLVLNELYRYYGVYRYNPATPQARCLPVAGP